MSRPRHFDRRVILGIALAILTLVLVVLYSNNSIDTYGVLVATRTLVPGAVIGPGDLAEVQVKLPPALAREAIPGSARDDLVGKTVAQTLYANQPIVRAQAGGEFAIPAGHVALTVAVSAETAAGGRLRPGDQVLVLLTLNKGRPEAQTTVVLERALVYDVGHDERFGTFSATGGAGVTAGPVGNGQRGGAHVGNAGGHTRRGDPGRPGEVGGRTRPGTASGASTPGAAMSDERRQRAAGAAPATARAPRRW